MAKPGSPRFRPGNKQADGSYPPIARQPKVVDTSEFKAASLIEGRDAGASESIEYMRWYVRNGPSLTKRAMIAKEMAKLGTPKPPVQLEHTGANGGPMLNQIEVVLVPAINGRRSDEG